MTATNGPDTWETVHVEVMDGDKVIGTYDRDYRMLQTSEPFRQGERNFALISPHYTASSVMDLQTGQVIAAEQPTSNGFCPAGFYVPDWWDVHHGQAVPGSLAWRPADDEWPIGGFGFVWGCVWGDDASRKVQYLDLTRVQDGVIARDDRFGCLPLFARPPLQARDFIRCSSHQGEARVVFAVEHDCTLNRGSSRPRRVVRSRPLLPLCGRCDHASP